ncbi:hypothetical protein COV56_02645 [Candidatus Kuenenbacteria bacterium CG11_big_fil_rev_8_21_14_0_20_37_9]|uniref:Photosynthesis system II assembly factor Ycf48/Hcf136-like domain-containing protein n=1 Tax=Candidatus Kuenenbacteria bacterium CG08_land_8_20_14_0_20_37_23 TaxID=1974617 RepID=A0A2M6XSD7_9BACT|nr:MAG: hypothetical protein COV56_02645 [Candidatus Kuenenbacteria bacterium CG11_big_fil_rev_8_21_14_0_20_37_9]PIU10550.1 MAG: hypothetical protein COT27_02475 [Candidatus Kuenenbacteria bacterium CG08_land_8_20_14_0_20_37_23]
MSNKFFLVIACAGILALLPGCSLLSIKDGGLGANGGKGIFFSSDRGANWQERNNLASSNEKINKANIHKLNFDFKDSRILYAGTDKGLYYSDDSAVSWQIIFANINIDDFEISPNTRGIIYVISGNGLHKTVDNGKNWNLVYTETEPGARLEDVRVSHFDTSRVYILNSNGLLIRSTDWGDSWKFLYDFNVNTDELYINPKNSLEMYVHAQDGLYQTKDEGINWNEIIRGQSEYFSGIEEHKDLFFSLKSNNIYYLSRYGLLKSADRGSSWKEIKLISSANSVDIKIIALNPKNDDEIYYVVNNILYHTFDGGFNWQTKVLPVNDKIFVSQLLVDFYDPNNLYIGLSR